MQAGAVVLRTPLQVKTNGPVDVTLSGCDKTLRFG